MRYIDMPRATGKTYQLCKISDKTNIPIIVANYKTKEAIEALNKKLYLNMIVYSYQEYLNLNPTPSKILIDEAFILLQSQIFPESEIKIVTYSSEDNFNQYKPFVLIEKEEDI